MDNFSVLDLLDLPPLERDVFLYLARNGSADARTLAGELGAGEVELQETLNSLVLKRRVRLFSDGQAGVLMGRVMRRTTLPADLWPAFLTADRLYTDQDIATLRTAIPMLQFARVRMSLFADHGPAHALRVKSIAAQVGYLLGLNATEQHFLGTAALFHDIGNIVERERHHIISQETIEKLAALGKLPFTPQETEVVGLVTRWHRREYDPQRIDHVNGVTVRTGLLASILRVTDAMDIDHRRSDYAPQMRQVLEFFYPNELPYWTSLEEILGVRLHCTSATTVQVFTRGPIKGNLQIETLHKEMAGTPLGWPIQVVPISNELPAPPQADSSSGRNLIAFPFEPHSLIMTAISRRHLRAAGCEVELLCYPDTEGGPSWLWCEALAKLNTGDFGRILVIGDRPAPELDSLILETVRSWQRDGMQASLFNRYEANWHRIPELLKIGAEVILGGEWSYFWGEWLQPADLAWGRIAALCVHDLTLSTVGLTGDEMAVMQGLLGMVYGAVSRPVQDTAGWSELAEPILDRISADDYSFFSIQAESFLDTYAQPPQPAHTRRRALFFNEAPGIWPQAYYWALEAAIEAHGRKPQAGVKYNKPYAIATWSSGESIELFAINHWREEDALPIRLLYPIDIGPPPQGTESVIHVRLPHEIAGAVVDRFLVVCDQQ